MTVDYLVNEGNLCIMSNCWQVFHAQMTRNNCGFDILLYIWVMFRQVNPIRLQLAAIKISTPTSLNHYLMTVYAAIG